MAVDHLVGGGHPAIGTVRVFGHQEKLAPRLRNTPPCAPDDAWKTGALNLARVEPLHE